MHCSYYSLKLSHQICMLFSYAYILSWSYPQVIITWHSAIWCCHWQPLIMVSRWMCASSKGNDDLDRTRKYANLEPCSVSHSGIMCRTDVLILHHQAFVDALYLYKTHTFLAALAFNKIWLTSITDMYWYDVTFAVNFIVKQASLSTSHTKALRIINPPGYCIYTSRELNEYPYTDDSSNNDDKHEYNDDSNSSSNSNSK